MDVATALTLVNGTHIVAPIAAGARVREIIRKLRVRSNRLHVIDTRRVTLAPLTAHLTHVLVTIQHDPPKTPPPARPIHHPRHGVTTMLRHSAQATKDAPR